MDEAGGFDQHHFSRIAKGCDLGVSREESGLSFFDGRSALFRPRVLNFICISEVSTKQDRDKRTHMSWVRDVPFQNTRRLDLSRQVI